MSMPELEDVDLGEETKVQNPELPEKGEAAPQPAATTRRFAKSGLIWEGDPDDTLSNLTPLPRLKRDASIKFRGVVDIKSYVTYLMEMAFGNKSDDIEFKGGRLETDDKGDYIDVRNLKDKSTGARERFARVRQDEVEFFGDYSQNPLMFDIADAHLEALAASKIAKNQSLDTIWLEAQESQPIDAASESRVKLDLMALAMWALATAQGINVYKIGHNRAGNEIPTEDKVDPAEFGFSLDAKDAALLKAKKFIDAKLAPNRGTILRVFHNLAVKPSSGN